MAFAVSTHKAQIPKPCDLCETDINIHWKCKQCDKYMCDKCKKIHLNVETPIPHDIIDFRRRNEDRNNTKTWVIDNIPCTTHSKNISIMFCVTCDKLVCPDCISRLHQKHNLQSIEKVCKDKVERLEVLGILINNDLIKCQSETKDTDQSENKLSSGYDDMILKIKQKEKEVIDSVHEYSKQLCSNVEMEKKSMKLAHSKRKKHIKHVKQALDHKQTELATALDTNQGGIIFSMAAELEGSLPDTIFSKLSIDRSEFVQEETTFSNVANFFGSVKQSKLQTFSSNELDLVKNNTQILNLKDEFEVVKSYTTDLPYIQHLLFVDNNQAWITNHANKILRQIFLNNNIKTIEEFSEDIFDLALTANNEVLFTVYNNSEVKTMTKSKEIKPFISVSPMQPYGIHVTKDNHILIGVTEKCEVNLFDKAKEEEKRQILVYGMDKKLKNIFEFDENKERLFRFPRNIKTNINGDVLVIDWTEDFEGRIVVLGSEGRKKWIYNGHPELNSSNNFFTPTAIVTTPLGHIVIVDYKSNALHVLSMTGDLLTCKIMEDEGIVNPQSLDMDNKGQLWVGCGDFSDKGATLHVVRIYC